ncbi:hypothetical protein F4819DRAFT_487945 [Hypoxylon fuscum]|nr:hypothetical protein F4819DRAFT_487945 [Hypoxylon fuscum]
MSSEDLKGKPLPSKAVDELAKVAAWLQSDAANFEVVDNIKICKNIDGLATATVDLLKRFTAEVKKRPTQNRITALHFDQPAIVPVEEGWNVDLIPVHLVEKPVEVESQQLNLGHYFHLTKEARVSGEFFAVLLLSQLP